MKLCTRLIWFIVLLLLCNAHSVLSQKLNFSLVSAAAESQWGFVTGITQDKLGFMWFSTGSGVQRYDGYKIITYMNEPQNPNSLSLNNTECIYADSSGIIWIGTRGAGLDHLNPVTGKFTHYRHDPNDPTSIIDDFITFIFEDHEGVFWIGTLQGLCSFDRKMGKFKCYKSDKNDSKTISNDVVKVIYEDRTGTLWVGMGNFWDAENLSGEGGLNRFDRKTGKFTRYMHDPKDPHSLIDNRVRAICEDSHGNFWVGTGGDGLHLMDRAKGTFQRLLYDPKHPEKLSRPALNYSPIKGGFDHITFIREDATGSIWIGTMFSGINRYNPKTKQTTHYGGDDSNGGLKGYHTWCSYMSRDGVIWISTIENNLYHVDPSQTIIPQVNTTHLSYFFYQDDPQILWEGTNSGLVQNDLTTGTKKIFNHDSLNSSSISEGLIFNVVSDQQGGLWVGTYGGGLNRYNPGSQTFLHYRHNEKDNRSLDNDYVNIVFVDRANNLWVGTDKGLNMLDSKTGYFKHYHNNPSDSNSLSSSNAVIGLLEDNDQNYLWVVTWPEDINRLNRQSGKFEHFIPNANIFGIINDHEGIIWVASSAGLFKYNRKNNNFEKYVDPNGSIKINNTQGIVEDSQYNLWLTSPDGIFKINKNRDQILVFNKNSGVKKNFNFIDWSAFKDLNGKLYFPTVSDSYYSFMPDSLPQKATIPIILMEDFKLGNESVQQGKGSPLEVPVNEAKEINLSYNQNVFSFNFLAIHYSSPEDNRIVFKLENYDKEWRKPGVEKTVQYFNVPPGHYIFRIKASTNMGIFTEREIIVNIAPPWWRTWWAYGAYAFMFMGCVFLVDRVQRKRLLAKAHSEARERELEQAREIEKANKLLEQQKEELQSALENLKLTQAELIQSEKMASLGQLIAGIAHEINTPLGAINASINTITDSSQQSINLLPALVKVLTDEELKLFMELVNRSALNNNTLSSKEEREVRKKIATQLGEKGISEADDFADILVDMGIYDEIENYLKLFKPQTMHSAYHLSMLIKNSQNIKMAVDRASKVVFALKNYARYGNENSMVEANITDGIETVLTLYQNQFKHGITLHKEFEEVPPILCYPDELNQVWTNLIHNAIQAMEGKGELSIHVEKHGRASIHVSITDTGKGIPPELKNHIFDAFFTTKPAGEGSGLGLYIVKQIIDKHKGTITFESEPGKGSVFIVSLPKRIENEA